MEALQIAKDTEVPLAPAIAGRARSMAMAALAGDTNVDVTIFDRLRRQSWWKAPLISSLLGSAVDTALFFSLAFAGTQVPWVTLGIGDYGAKLFMAAALLLPFRVFIAMLPAHLAQTSETSSA